MKDRSNEVRIMPAAFKAFPVKESVAIPAGAQGTIVEFQLPIAPVLDADGTIYGGDGNSSLSWTTGTTFTREVAFNTPDASLVNGDFYINYVTGQGRGKKDDAATADIAIYEVPMLVESNPDGVVQEVFTFVTAAASKTFSKKPHRVFFKSDQDCWVNFNITATGALPDLFIPKNILIGALPISASSFSVKRDTADGNLLAFYTTYDA